MPLGRRPFLTIATTTGPHYLSGPMRSLRQERVQVRGMPAALATGRQALARLLDRYRTRGQAVVLLQQVRGARVRGGRSRRAIDLFLREEDASSLGAPGSSFRDEPALAGTHDIESLRRSLQLLRGSTRAEAITVLLWFPPDGGRVRLRGGSVTRLGFRRRRITGRGGAA